MIHWIRAGTFLSPLVLVVLLFGLLPPLLLFASGIGDIGGVQAVPGIVEQPLNLAAFSNSLEQGILSAGFAVALGYPAGSSWDGTIGRDAERSEDCC